MDIREIDRILSPDEDDKQYNNFNSDKGLLDIAKKVAPITALGGAAYMGKSAIPKNLPYHLSTHAMNFLEGFYKKGANKTALYAEEFGKSLGRLGYTATHPREAISYANTGVSKLVEDKIHNIQPQLDDVNKKYISGDYGKSGQTAVDKALQNKSKVIKEVHYKVLNDAANREIFHGINGEIKQSKLLNDYRRRKPHLKNYWDFDKTGKGFLKSTGGDNTITKYGNKLGNKIIQSKANYITSRHHIGHAELPYVGRFFKKQRLYLNNPNITYIKWFDNNISGILRGAQFNYPTYEVLEAMKKNKMGQSQALSALKSAGFNPKLFKDGKIMFSFSPAFKSQFDWGGYNAVAEWDYKRPQYIKFHATDLRDTPISSATGGRHVLNYTESKEFKIKSMKKYTDIDNKPKLRPVKSKSKSTISRKKPKISKMKDAFLARESRKEIVASGKLNSSSQQKNMMKNLGIISKSKAKSREMIKLKTISKNMLKYGKYAGKATSAVGLLALAAMLYNKD